MEITVMADDVMNANDMICPINRAMERMGLQVGQCNYSNISFVVDQNWKTWETPASVRKRMIKWDVEMKFLLPYTFCLD